MEKHLIDFNKFEWIKPMIGAQYKAYINGNIKIRIVEFSEGLIEPDWCKNGHTGYVIKGECNIDFNGNIEHYKEGDIIHIPSGEADKHMVIMDKGGWVQMLLFEQV